MHKLKTQNNNIESNDNRIILNTASLGGFIPITKFPVYTAAKFGVVGFTKAIGEKSFADHGVRVVALAPAFVKTPMVVSAMDKDPGLLNVL